MLRAGYFIDIQNENIESNSGVILAPIIKLHDLILRADAPVPDKIKEFLQEHNIKVNRVKYKGSLFVRLMGDFKISKEQCDLFAKDNKGLVKAQAENLSNVLSAKVIEYEILRKFEIAEKQNNETSFILNGNIVSLKTNCSILSNSIMQSGTEFSCGQHMISPTTMTLGAGEKLMIKGSVATVSSGEKVCLLGQARAVDSAILKGGNIHLDNTLAGAGNELKLSGKSLLLYMDSKVTWANNPHPELFGKKQNSLEYKM